MKELSIVLMTKTDYYKLLEDRILNPDNLSKYIIPRIFGGDDRVEDEMGQGLWRYLSFRLEEINDSAVGAMVANKVYALPVIYNDFKTGNQTNITALNRLLSIAYTGINSTPFKCSMSGDVKEYLQENMSTNVSIYGKKNDVIEARCTSAQGISSCYLDMGNLVMHNYDAVDRVSYITKVRYGSLKLYGDFEVANAYSPLRRDSHNPTNISFTIGGACASNKIKFMINLVKLQGYDKAAGTSINKGLIHICGGDGMIYDMTENILYLLYSDRPGIRDLIGESEDGSIIVTAKPVMYELLSDAMFVNGVSGVTMNTKQMQVKEVGDGSLDSALSGPGDNVVSAKN